MSQHIDDRHLVTDECVTIPYQLPSEIQY